MLIPDYEIENWKVIAPLVSPMYLSAFVWSRDDTEFDADYTYEKNRYPEQINFDHSFAKVFWGTDQAWVMEGDDGVDEDWG